MGFINYKDVKATDISEKYDSERISHRIQFLKQRKTRFEKEIAGIDRNDSNYYRIWEEITRIENQIYDLQVQLDRINSNRTYEHTINITLY